MANAKKKNEPLDLTKECENTRDRLDSSKYSCHFRFDQGHEDLGSRLDEFLSKYNPQIVHFSGHGSSDHIILCQGAEGQTESSEIKSIANLFRILNELHSLLADKKVTSIGLNTCYFEKQARAISKPVDFEVAMKNTIRFNAAREFAGIFYHSLCFLESIHTAIDLCKNKIERINS